jgi:nucleoside-diphosphate-sugar epimerase
MRKRTILVTGSSGRLGAPLALALGRDHEVIQLDAREPHDPAHYDLGPIHIGSIADPEFVAEAMHDVDTVIHCAAIPSSRKPYPELLNVNVMGTFHLLEEAGRRKEVEQFIYISSLMWHGLSEAPFDHVPHYLPINENHPSLAVDYYACSKVQAEYWCEKYVQRFRKPVVVIRPPYIVALHEQPRLTACPAPAYPYLNDYIGVTDLIDGIVRAIDYDPPNGFDQFLLHAADQRSTTPSLDLVERFWPKVAIDRGKLGACDGFGAFIDTAHAEDRLHWKPVFRCQR